MTFAHKFPEIVHDRPNAFDDGESKRKVFDQLDRQRGIGTLVTSRAAERHGAMIKRRITASECLDLLELEVVKIVRDAMAGVPIMEWNGARRSSGEYL